MADKADINKRVVTLIAAKPQYVIKDGDTGTQLIVDINTLFEATYAIMLLLRSFGFSADDLFFATDMIAKNFPPDMLFYGVALVTQGKRFSVNTYPQDAVHCLVTTAEGEQQLFCSQDTVVSLWTTFLGIMQAPNRQLDPAQETRLKAIEREYVGVLTVVLRARGFSIPVFDVARDEPPN